MKKQTRNWTIGVLGAAAVVTGITAAVLPHTTEAAQANVTLAETGSSLLYPLFNGQWVPAYTKANPSVKITSASTGSGTGISDAINGTVQIGASDAYLSPADVQQNPNMENIPLAISAQQIMYHLPGMSVKKHLHLTGTVIADMYEGRVRFWDSPQIKKLNPGVKLPHHMIIPVHRTDGSGDTFLFTQFMTDTNPVWAKSVQFGTSISWPSVAGGVGAEGNSGVVQALQSNEYSIGYVGISYLDTATKEGIGYAALQNKAGNYVLPTASTIQAAATVGAKKTPANESISLIYASGKNSYPIINFEYAIINTKQANATNAAAVKKFLTWAINGGNTAKFLKPVHFLPLPKTIKPLSEKQIAKIGN